MIFPACGVNAGCLLCGTCALALRALYLNNLSADWKYIRHRACKCVAWRFCLLLEISSFRSHFLLLHTDKRGWTNVNVQKSTTPRRNAYSGLKTSTLPNHQGWGRGVPPTKTRLGRRQNPPKRHPNNNKRFKVYLSPPRGKRCRLNR